jgi:hypothetical protein
MIDRLRNFFSELEKRRGPEVPARINRSHFLNSSDPVEARLAQALCGFPEDELLFLVLKFGLNGQNPKAPHDVAETLGMILLKVLDTGTAAELRLRNRAETRALIEAIAGDEVPEIVRHFEVISSMPDEQNRRAATDLWFYSRRPIRRLAMSTALEGGFDAFLALVRRKPERMSQVVAKDYERKCSRL